MHIFRKIPLRERSLMQRLFRQHPEENPIIELNNLLAENSIEEISISNIHIIEKKYNIVFQRDFLLNLEEFYATLLHLYLKDNMLNSNESARLEKLAALLSLPEKSVGKIHEMIGAEVYQKALEEAIVGGKIGDKESTFIENLEKRLKLPQSLTKKISHAVRSAHVQAHAEKVIENLQFSPAEEEALHLVADNLQVTISLTDITTARLAMLRSYWLLENHELPVYQPDIRLQKNELCHFVAARTGWYETRAAQTEPNHFQYSANMKAIKRFYIKNNSYKSNRTNTASALPLDTGYLYLTNKRIILTGSKKNFNIRLEKILDITPSLDGIKITKEVGKNPILSIPEGGDIFCIILDKLIKEL